MWKNCQRDEDCNGQRILLSQSQDAMKWTPPIVLFPNLTTPELAATLEPGPPVHLNGRLYMACSPGIHNSSHDSSAQGSQFCLWPDPLDKRNCGPPTPVAVQYNHTLLMREVLPGGNGSLGALFWASEEPPALFAAATKAHGIRTLGEMDSQTFADVATLSSELPRLPCNASDGTLKCEACLGGCQIYSSIDFSLRLANERTHWKVPGRDMDVIAYRSEDNFLYTSVRVNSTLQNAWQMVQQSNIPNDNSNLNAGPLPDGRVYLVHNPVTPASGRSWSRDPVTVATSRDGITFDQVGVAMTCTDLGNNSTCSPRYDGKSKNPGPSYPQALTVVDPAPGPLQGFYVCASNNKEDIWVAKVEYGDLQN